MGEATDYETITVGSSAVGLNPDKIESVMYVKITVERAPVNIRIDGQKPSSIDGHLVNANGQMIVQGKMSLRHFMAIAENGATSILKVTYFAGESCGEGLEIRNDGTSRMVTTVHYYGANLPDRGSNLAVPANLQGLKTLGVTIRGNAQGLNIAFLGSVDGIVYAPISGAKMSDPAMPMGNMTNGSGVTVIGAATVDHTTQIWTMNNHGLKMYQEIYISSADTLPSGIDPYTRYYAAPINANTFYVFATLPAPGSSYGLITPPVFCATVTDNGYDVIAIFSGSGELWQFDVNGIQYFKPRIDAILNGFVTIISYGEG